MSETTGVGGESAVVVYGSNDQRDGVEETKQDVLGVRGSGFESLAPVPPPPLQQVHQNEQQQLPLPQRQVSQPPQQQHTPRAQPKTHSQSPSCHSIPKRPRTPTPATYKGPENNQALLKQMMVSL